MKETISRPGLWDDANHAQLRVTKVPAAFCSLAGPGRAPVCRHCRQRGLPAWRPGDLGLVIYGPVRECGLGHEPSCTLQRLLEKLRRDLHPIPQLGHESAFMELHLHTAASKKRLVPILQRGKLRLGSHRIYRAHSESVMELRFKLLFTTTAITKMTTANSC